MTEQRDIVVVGGGAAGYFAAIHAAELAPDANVLLVESGAKPLRKVAISGGGRCNVTNHCFEPEKLIQAYPRGGRELRGPLTRFQPRDTMQWFESRGVTLKTEPDSRVFPVSDDSQTIIDCLEHARKKCGVELSCNTKLRSLVFDSATRRFRLTLKVEDDSREIAANAVLLASGSDAKVLAMAGAAGHTIASAVPSLFTFEIEDPRISDLAGISVPDSQARLRVGDKTFEQAGPLLITHWGLSGPAVLRLSAWAARELASAEYRAELEINWLGGSAAKRVADTFTQFRRSSGGKTVKSSPYQLPKRLWERVIEHAGIECAKNWADLTAAQSASLIEELTRGRFNVSGKGVFKEEFITCGGVALNEVDFRTMQSKTVPRLFFAGEILDIDGITGGFNFQSAWTTGWIAGENLASF